VLPFIAIVNLIVALFLGSFSAYFGWFGGGNLSGSSELCVL